MKIGRFRQICAERDIRVAETLSCSLSDIRKTGISRNV